MSASETPPPEGLPSHHRLSVVPPAGAAVPNPAPPRPTPAPATPAAPAIVPAAPAIVPAAPGPAPAPVGKPLAAVPKALPPARPSRVRRRHKGIIAAFLGFVLAPLVVSVWYLWAVAADQYASTLGFSVHREDMSSAISLISGLSSLSGSSSADTDIIYRYIYSQQVVAEIQDELDLVSMWSRPGWDPVFAFHKGGSIEDLLDYWQSMVKVYYDSSTHLIEIRVLAFAPEDAQRIAQAIFDKSTVMINRLNDIATEDAIRFTRDELNRTRDQLVLARQAMTAFRNKYQIVDPASDVAVQTSILASLQQELAATLIDFDMLRGTAPETDPRLPPMERRIQVIEDRIKAERSKLGMGGVTGEGAAFADMVADYERLTVDLEFAEASYHAARAANDGAQAEARQQSRYLAAHILPTRAESSRYPERGMLLAVIGVFLFMLWAVAALVFYSIRDRR